MIPKTLPEVYPDERPSSRRECMDMERPCPFVSCRYHLYLEVRSTGKGFRVNSLVRGIPPDEIEVALRKLPDTCSLDVADRSPGGMTLEKVGRRMGITRERVRQLEASSLKAFDRIWEAITK